MNNNNEIKTETIRGLDELFKAIDDYESQLTDEDIDELYTLDALRKKTKGAPHEL
jgi:hypothetical protein